MRPLRVLAVCTGNICRSPVAERAITRHLGGRSIPVTARSAGTQGGLRNDATMVKAAREAGYDLTTHVSRPIDSTELAQADLVVAMDRSHIERVVPDAPAMWPRTFTLAELVRRAESLPPNTRVDTFDEWIAAVGTGRTTDDVFNAPASDDIADPHGFAIGKHRAAVDRIDQLAARLAELIAAQVVELGGATGRRPSTARR